MTDPILISLKQRFARGRLRSLAKHSYYTSENVTKSTIFREFAHINWKNP